MKLCFFKKGDFLAMQTYALYKKEKAKRTLCQVGIGIVGLPYGAK